MARADPWAQFADAPEDAGHSYQPPQQAMGRGGPSPPAPVPQPQAGTPADDPFAQFAESDPATPRDGGVEAEITDEPVAVSRLSPEDEAKVRQYIAAGDADGAEAFAAHKGFHLTNAKQLVEQYAGAQDRIPDSVYQLAKVETGAPDALARGIMDTVSMGTLPKVGAAIAGAESALTGGSFGDAYDHMLDANNATVGADEQDHPWMRLSGQLLGGLAIPTGLEGVGLKAGSEVLRIGGTMKEARAAASIAVRNRMAAVGGAYGAAHGAGSADNVPDAVTGALTEGTVGAVTGGAIGATGQALQPRFAARAAAARAAPITDAQRTMRAADRQGIDVMPADVGGPTTRRATSVAAQTIAGGQPVIAAAARTVDQSQAARDRAAEAIGTALRPEAAGQAGIRGARSFIARTSARARQLYGEAVAEAAGVRITPAQAVNTLDQHIAELSETPGGVPGLARLQTLRDQLASGDFTVGGIRNMRTVLRDQFMEEGLTGSDIERRVGQVLDSATQDVTNGLNAAGRPEAARLFQAADRYWRNRIRTIDNVIEPLVGKDYSKSGEQVVKTLTADLQGNNRRAVAFLRTLPPEEQSTVRASIIGGLGRAKKGAQDADGNGFSLQTFLTNWNEIGDTAKNAYFGPEARAALNDLAQVAQGTREAQAYANRSNTGGAIGNLLTLGSGVAGVATFGKTIATQYGLGRLLASPRFARWLARAPRTQLSGPAYIDRLGRIARSEPAIANEVLNLQQRLTDAMRVTPQRAAASESEETPDRSTWDKRPDGSTKSFGYLGLMKRPDGNVSSELSVGVDWGEGEKEIPTMVPGLSKQEVDWLLNTPEEQIAKQLPDSIREKAIAHAKKRLAAGLSPFRQDAEHFPVHGR